MPRFLFTIILSFLIIQYSAISQKYAEGPYAPRTTYGLFGGGNFNLHTADFKGFKGYESCCPGYETGSGFGLNFGGFVAFPITDKMDLTFRAVYTGLSAEISRTEDELLGGNNGSVDGQFEHRIDAVLNSAGLQALVGFKLSDQLRLHGGFRAGYMLASKFSQVEEIVSPDYGVFMDTKSTTRNVYNDKEIPDASTIEAALMAGITYDLPLNSSYTFFLVPEAFFSFGLTSFAPDMGWQANYFGAGIGIRYAPRGIIPPKPPPPPPPPPPLPPPPPPPSAPVLDATIAAFSVEKDGSESGVSTMKVEEFLSTRTHPILSFVFFEENSSTLPSRYIRISEEEKKTFSVKRLYDLKTMNVYYRVLDIVGKRMSVYPQSNLDLTGCNSDFGGEKNNKKLSADRANVVKEYLMTKWGIPESRLKTKARNLPAVPSNNTLPEGRSENRRVEMSSNVQQIFEPMIIQDTLRIPNPPHIRFRPQVNAEIGIKSWKIITSQSQGTLRVFAGDGPPPEKIDWEVEKEDEQEFVPRFNEPLAYMLEVVDNDNKVWQSPPQYMPVEQITIETKIFEMIEDKEIDKFSLILFDFDKATLGKENESIVKIARNRIRKNSTVAITGYSDRTGEEQHNLKLSQRRANATAKALGMNLANAKGVGESQLLYDNDTPEGRFYCRTVIIEIVTPIE